MKLRFVALCASSLAVLSLSGVSCSENGEAPIGDGDGDDSGDGDGDGDDSGDGDGDDSGDGDGDGDDSGDGDGDGDDSGDGDGDGDGDDSGDGDGDGDGSAGASGDGDGSAGAAGDGDGDGSAGATGDGDGDGAPEMSLCQSDKACTSLDMVCDPERRVCVDCVDSDDCAGDSICESGICVDVEICGSSKDCDSSDHVCVDDETFGGMCLECGMQADCADDEMCVSNECVEACESDKDCSDSNEICRASEGYCNECHDGIGCGEDEYCDGSTCHAQVCEPGSTFCLGDEITGCDEMGAGYTAPSSCGEYSCKTTDGEGACDYPPSEKPDGALNDNGDFAAGGDGWEMSENSSAPATNGMFCGEGDAWTDLGWPLDVSNALQLEDNKRYVIQFRTYLTLADAESASGELQFKVGGAEDPYRELISADMSVEEGVHEHSAEFVMDERAGNIGMVFALSSTDASLCIDDIWITPAD